jgi:hypothetical protein
VNAKRSLGSCLYNPLPLGAFGASPVEVLTGSTAVEINSLIPVGPLFASALG